MAPTAVFNATMSLDFITFMAVQRRMKTVRVRCSGQCFQLASLLASSDEINWCVPL